MSNRTYLSAQVGRVFSRRDLLRAAGVALPLAVVGRGWMPAYAQTTSSFDFYISPTGSDSNPGTLASPWSITALTTQQAAYAGKSVGLLDGTYDITSIMNSAPIDDEFRGALKFTGGTAGSPTVIAAVNPRQAVISMTPGTSHLNPMLSNYGMPSREYATIDGIVFSGFGTKAIYCGYNSNSYNGFRGILIKNCEFQNGNAANIAYGQNLSAVEFAGCDGAVVQNCYFHDNQGYSANDGDHFSATIEWWCTRTVYEYNTVVRSGCGFYAKEHGGAGDIIRYNYVDASMITNANPGGKAIGDFSGSTSDPVPPIGNVPMQVHHNVMLGGSYEVIDFTGGLNFTQQVWGAEIYNNTMIGNSANYSVVRVIEPPGLFKMYNNLVVPMSGEPHLTLNVDFAGLLDYQYYDTSRSTKFRTWPIFSGSHMSYTEYSSLTALQAAMLSIVETHAVQGGDPQFVATGSGADYYKLQAGSPAKNAGSSDGTLAGTAVDMGAWGNTAPPSIGCDFAAGSSSRPSPPANLSVG